MADLKNIIAEMRLIGDAMAALGKFDYVYASEINFNRGKDYPICILEKHPQLIFDRFVDGYKQYTFNIDFFDVYLESTTDEDGDTVAISDMESVCEQYMREFVKRYKADPSGKPWHIIGEPVAKGNEVAFQDNDRLAGITVSFELRVFSDCETGTFNY